MVCSAHSIELHQAQRFTFAQLRGEKLKQAVIGIVTHRSLHEYRINIACRLWWWRWACGSLISLHLLLWILLKILFGREVIATFLFTVASADVFGEVYLFLGIDISRKTSFVFALRAGVSGGSAFVWF